MIGLVSRKKNVFLYPMVSSALPPPNTEVLEMEKVYLFITL